MARTEKNNVDYFPFLCKEGRVTFYIESKYGNDGFATWIKILREIAVTSNHFLDLSSKTDMMYLSAKCRVSENVLDNIISDLSDMGQFDKELWYQYKIIWCQKFIDNIQDAYKKRNNKCITFQGLIDLLIAKGIRKSNKSNPKGSGNTHIIKENSKEENKIEKKTIEDRKSAFAYSLSEFKDKYPREMLVKFLEYWTEKNKSGTKMKFEMQTTWELPLRLSTWASRDKDFTGQGTNTPTSPSKPIPKPLTNEERRNL